MAAVKIGILEAIKSANPDELQAIDERITELEKELDSLRAVKKAIDIRLNGNPKRAPRAPRQPRASGDPGTRRGSLTEQQRQRVVQYLLKNGMTLAMKLASECDIPTGSISGVINHEWFQKTPNGILLTSVAKQLFG